MDYRDYAAEENDTLLEIVLKDSHKSRCDDHPFPMKIHKMLTQVEQEGLSHIVSWQSHGRCFMVRNQKEFEEYILPSWFRMSKIGSFQRQISIYGFRRLKNGYYHEMFLRDKLFLCRRIVRNKTKSVDARKSVSQESEPDFYQMSFLPAPETTIQQTWKQSAVAGIEPQPNPNDSQVDERVDDTQSSTDELYNLDQQLALQYKPFSGSTSTTTETRRAERFSNTTAAEKMAIRTREVGQQKGDADDHRTDHRAETIAGRDSSKTPPFSFIYAAKNEDFFSSIKGKQVCVQQELSGVENCQTMRSISSDNEDHQSFRSVNLPVLQMDTFVASSHIPHSQSHNIWKVTHKSRSMENSFHQHDMLADIFGFTREGSPKKSKNNQFSFFGKN